MIYILQTHGKHICQVFIMSYGIVASSQCKETKDNKLGCDGVASSDDNRM